MKKNLIFILLLSVFTIKVNADCDYKKQAQLIKEAALVKVNYEIITEKNDTKIEDQDIIVHSDKDSFKITVYNITENMRVEKTVDNGTPEVITYDKTEEGKYVYYVDDTENIQKHSFKIYSADTSCGNKVFKTVKLTKPKFNEYSLYSDCESIPEYTYCKKYVEQEINISEEVFSKNVKQYKKNLTTTKKKKVEEKSFDYTYYIIGAVVIIAIGLGVYFVVQKKRSEF